MNNNGFKIGKIDDNVFINELNKYLTGGDTIKWKQESYNNRYATVYYGIDYDFIDTNIPLNLRSLISISTTKNIMIIPGNTDYRLREYIINDYLHYHKTINTII